MEQSEQAEQVKEGSSEADQLAECWGLLFEIVRSPRPMAGGFKARAKELLIKHGFNLGEPQCHGDRN